MDVQRVPAVRAQYLGRSRGAALKPFLKVTAKLKLESHLGPADTWLMEADDRRLIQKAVKRPGRLRRLLDVSDGDWDDMGEREKLKRIAAKIRTTTDKSQLGALTLGARFVGGEIRREGVES